jgi:hypothetical protein
LSFNLRLGFLTWDAVAIAKSGSGVLGAELGRGTRILGGAGVADDVPAGFELGEG